ncbi:hypothetical protein AYK26_01520 [Euryarchaeota archaeon SM23-78]|nr:MAG: hypothetical protein AYK26_01520 [Euryarchaeota archaeon SM23-78]MBW3000454.1 class I SAM-dependent methyltransferase [Candidatus Woesearchaeota archaeon]
MKSEKEVFEKIYEEPGAVWTREVPQQGLVELVEKKIIKPCKAIDIGCGEGTDSICLASKGFDVTGIDFSEKAIGYAKENAAKKGVNINFIVLDIDKLSQIKEKFDFVLEFGFLHHVAFEKRKKYVQDVANLLKPGGKYLSACFNEQSPDFDEKGKKIRKSPVGTTIYYSSIDELKQLFEPYFNIIEAKIIEMKGGGKGGFPHIGNYFFMEK